MLDVFFPKLFIGRDSELAKLVRWATEDKVPRRLTSIAGPPGYGKSWLLHQLESLLSTRRDLFVIRVSPLELRSRTDIIKWLPHVVKRAKGVCPEFVDNDQSNSPEAMIAQLLENLCKTCSPILRPVLIVDSLDEPSENESKALEKHLLEQFWRNPCVRMVISFRDDHRLNSHILRRGESRMLLVPFSKDEGHQQLDKRSELAGENLQISREDLLKIVAPYTLNIPGINTILSKRIKQNETNNQEPVLSADDLRDCWQELVGVELTRRPENKEILEKDLRIMAQREDTWTLETFARICGYSENDALHHLNSLMSLSIVLPPVRGQRYQLVDGLREILRAEIRLRDEK